VSAADREAAVDAIVRRARTVAGLAGLAGEIVDALARAEAAEAECARLTTERDAARAEAAGLRAAIAAERAVRAAWLATLPACATAPADVVDAEAATGAALDTAGEGRSIVT